MIPQEQNVPKTVDLKLQRLTKLTDVVNKRYKKGLNDDDQVAAMFKYIDNDWKDFDDYRTNLIKTLT